MNAGFLAGVIWSLAIGMSARAGEGGRLAGPGLGGAWNHIGTIAFLDSRQWHNFGRMVQGKIPSRKSLALHYGLSYTPDNDTDFFLVSWRRVYRYGDVWLHRTPQRLFFSWEAALGGRLKIRPRWVASCGIFAIRYLNDFPESGSGIRWYLEGGIGLIYTQFTIEGQGSRLNFNPRLSVGMEIGSRTGGSRWFTALRAFHLSNAGLCDENQGINAIMLVVGRFF